jgi:hypothetical protein
MTINNDNKRFSFSGHESFQCRSLWLKKGYDFIVNKNSFNEEEAVVKLGVGKNMVASIRFWMKAFDLLDNDDNLTEIAHKIFSDIDGWDAYLEDEATLWLLHFHLIHKGFATTYDLLFNELRKGKIEFTKENFISFVNRKAEVLKLPSPSVKTIIADFDVMVKMYIRTNAHSNDREESFSGILSELDLIKNFNRGDFEYYVIEQTEKSQIPAEILFYGILLGTDNDLTIDFTKIEQDYNNVGNIFAINRTGLIEKIQEITDIFRDDVVFSDQAGIRQLQFKNKRLQPLDVLKNYYEKIYAE